MKKRLLFIGLGFCLLHCSITLALSPLVGDKEITLGKAGRFDFMQVDREGRRLLAAHKEAGTLELLDLKTGAPLASIPTGAAQGLAIDSKNNRYYVGDDDEKRVVVIDTQKLVKRSEIKVDAPIDGIALDTKNGMLYADQDKGRKIWVIDTRTEKVVSTIPILGDPEYIEYSPVNDRIYQNIKTNDTLIVIDPNSNKIEHTWSTLPVNSPHGLAIDEQRSRIFVAGKNGKLASIDLKTGKVIASVDIGPSVDQIAYDSEKRIIYCAGKGQISVVRETDSGLESLGGVPSPPGVHTLAVDPASHSVWVSYSDQNRSYFKKFNLGAE